MGQLNSNGEMVFVVLQFPYGTRAWVPLSCYEQEFEGVMELEEIVELGRTRDPQELERLMGGGKENDA